MVRRPSSGRAPGAPTARAARPDTHADDGGHEQQHQHGHVEDDDTQQQEQHSGGGFCSAEFPSGLTGDTAELDVRLGELARAGERGREGRREGRREERREGRREGPALGMPGPGPPPAHHAPRPPREGSSRPQHPCPAASRAEHLLLLEENKRYERRTSKSSREGGFFQSAKQRLQRASTHPGAPGAAQLAEGGQERESERSPGGVEVGARGKGLGLCERPGDTSGVPGGRARDGEPGPQTAPRFVRLRVSTQVWPARGSRPDPTTAWQRHPRPRREGAEPREEERTTRENCWGRCLLPSPGAGRANALRALAGGEQVSVRRRGGGNGVSPPINKCSSTEPAGPLLSATVWSSPHTSHPGSDLREDPHVAKTELRLENC